MVWCILTVSVYAQVPNKFNYQAVLRNNAGELIKNQSVTVQISIIDSSLSGTTIYREQHAKITNNYGQVDLIIGNGSSDIGTFSDINWTVSDKFVKIEVNTGSGLTSMGTSQLLAVPYAMYANEVLNKNDADADSLNEIQNLTLEGVNLSISKGNTIDLGILQDGVDDADNDSTNEIQDLNLTNNVLTITRKSNPTEINLAAFTGTNTDEQQLSLNETILSISGGNTVDLSPLQDGVNDADSDPANELQNLTLTGDTLKMSNGNQVVFPYDSSKWAANGNKLYYNTGNVGIGTNDPMSKLEVKSTSTTGALFQVINANNDTVFAVYPDGVKVFVDPTAKGTVGGFAVSGRTPTKLGGSVEYFRVTPDSTRIYVNDSLTTKGKVGGFAVSGRTPTKGILRDYFSINKDSTRIYINDSLASKGSVGGFAVSGRTPTKGSGNELLFINSDSTRIYVNDTSITKGKVGGFAVSGRTPTKGDPTKFMDMTKENYFIGHNSGSKNISGKYNSFVGYESGRNNDHGENNVFLGFMSGYTNSGGNNNTFLGHLAGYKNSNGSNNVFLGDSAGYFNDSGQQNIFLGNGSGKNNSNGEFNAFIGFRSGHKNSLGKNNAFIGYEAGFTNDEGNNNAFIGYQAGRSTYRGSKNVFIGYKAGYTNYGDYEGPANMGNNNIYIGDSTGYNNMTGRSNVYIGHNAGSGKNPIKISSPPIYNVYIGYQTGYNEYAGTHNTFIGYQAGYSDSTGNYCTFIGYKSGNAQKTGHYNTFIGYRSGILHTDGGFNLFLGTDAGYNNIIGTNNVFLGYRAGYYETGSNKLFIDNQDRTNEATARTKSIIYGEFNATVTNQQLTINGKTTTNGSFNYGVDLESSDAYVVTIQGVSAYVAGMVIIFKANSANVNDCTVNVNSLGAKSLKAKHDTDPISGYIEAGSIIMAVYDGTNFQMIQPSAN
ncbi:MAG: hypothetical protein A2W99_09470 [Bacteroidetes bacterium GWF2_33_16]|nr:MAG: hypothetical protein A2X00_06380 [Bacteroidetes bacterium GWE2_32_14]OFY07226.1 MAG: hypothetical protein A2W99_09470 [Bacteroidetes bacterium GWF2_33_16]